MLQGSDSIYDSNKTMRLLGKQRTWTQVPLKEVFKQIDDILKASNTCKYKRSNTDICMDVFCLGFIYGRRAERARKNLKNIR